MLKKILFGLVLAGALAAPVFAETASSGTSGDSLNYLQPTGPQTLQPTGSVGSTQNQNSGTSLQPAGSKDDIINLLAQEADGSPRPAASQDNSNLSSNLMLAAAALGFLITAIIIYRTSKRLESLQSSAEVDKERDTAADLTNDQGEDQQIAPDDSTTQSDSLPDDTEQTSPVETAKNKKGEEAEAK